MSIYRCNSCGFIAEVTPIPGQSHCCGRCAQPVSVYETVFFVEKLLQRYAATLREVKILREDAARAADDPGDAAPAPEAAAPQGTEINHAMLASPEQHMPLDAWFRSRRIEAEFQYENVNMDGYFDEAARQIGQHFTLLDELLGRVAWSYRKNHTSLNIDLSRMAQKDATTLNHLCKSWYNGALFSKYFYQKNEKVLRLGLQSAAPARQFFNGTWLEWYALDCVLDTLAKQAKAPFSCARGVRIRFPNEDVQELDVVVLMGQMLLVIECKSGEFRHDIDKLGRLQKRLNLHPTQFIVCAPQLDDPQAQGMSHMYGMTFLSLPMLAPYLERLTPMA